MAPNPHNLQFVWPKDGPKGRSGHRGFWGQMNNILTNRGPDIYLQRKGSSTAIKPDIWGNWDSYHMRRLHIREEAGPFVSRGTRRYDPVSRRYVHWSVPHDWYGNFIGQHGEHHYPRFTRDEVRKMNGQLRRGRQIDPESFPRDRKFRDEWTPEGPRRFQQEYDYFWQNAHRVGENLREGYHETAGINPFLRMHQNHYDDFVDWVYDDFRGVI